MRWMRVSAGVLGVFAVAAIGVVVFVATLDLNAYKPEIEAAVEEATGRRLSIDGEIGLTWTPRPTLTTSTVHFANASWGSRPDMATVGRLEVAVEVLPLISGTLDVQRVTLADVDVLLERNADGAGNWAFAGDGEGAAAASGPTAMPLLREVSLSDVTVTWRPAPGAEGQTLRIATLEMAAEGLADPLDVTLEADVDGALVTLSGTLPSVSEAFREGATLPVDLAGRIGDQEIALAANLRYALSKDGALASVEADRLSFGLDGLAMDGSASAVLGGPRPAVKVALKADAIDVPETGDAGDGDPLEAPLPFDLLTAIDGDFGIVLGRLTSGDLTLSDIDVKAVLKDGVLTVDRAAALLSDGRIEAVAVVNAAEATARQSLTATWRGADFGKLIETLQGSSALEARGDAALDLTASGGSVRDMLAALGGTAWIVTQQGRISNQGWELIAEDLTTTFLPFVENTDRGVLNCAVGRWALKRGVADTQILMIDSDRVTIAGEGTVDLARERLDMRLVPKPKDASLISLSTPILLTGSLRDPGIAPDPLAVAKGVGSLVGGVALAGPFAALLPFMSDGSDEPACPEAVAIAEGRKAMPKASGSVNPASGEQQEKPGGIRGLFDSLRKAVE
ncbi:MAG: AsmA family protein [Alphaproteobacteria bacterium]|nr:AsmA family protein [Alphaproteobacteria bacterium]